METKGLEDFGDVRSTSEEQESGRNAGSECTCKSNGSVPGFFHGADCPLKRDARLIFPCGAYFPVKHGDEILDAAHRAKDGAYRISVHPSSKPLLDDNGECLARVKRRWRLDYDGKRAPCQYFCPDSRRRKEETGYDGFGVRGKYISCHARLYSQEHLSAGDEGWYDITPIPPAKCPHCEEQRTYVQACRRAAKYRDGIPDRTKWRKCPHCGQYRETYEETGMCAGCQLAKVLTDA